MHSRVRERLGFLGSLIIHFLLFITVAVSGVLLPQAAADETAAITFFAAGGGGGGGGGSELEPPGSMPVAGAGEQQNAALPRGAILGRVLESQLDGDAISDAAPNQASTAEQAGAVPASSEQGQQGLGSTSSNEGSSAGKRGYGSGTGSGGGHGSGRGTGTGSGTGPGSGSGSGGGHGSGHGTGIGSGTGPGNGIWRQPAVPPRITATVAPSYPAAAKKAGVEGVALLQLVIGMDGRVEAATVLRSSGDSSLDAAAVSAAKGWRFTAARSSSGQKVRCYYNLPMRFSLKYE
ncbi:MAG: energy transducer TonB [Phascolarctobacterium sp.]